MDTSNVYKGLLFGGIASCIAEVITLPVDVVKTRLQLQGQLGAQKQYSGLVDCIVQTGRKEGFKAFFKGLAPALLRQSTYGSLRYGLYTPIKGILGLGTDANPPLWKKIVAGAAAGAISSAVCNPTDLIKVRLQADGMSAGSTPRYRGMWDAFRTIVRAEGVTGLWKGVGPTCARATVLAAVEMPAYDEIKRLIVGHALLGAAHSRDGLVLHAVTATAAGFLCALASSPFDVAKSRMMNQPFDPVTGRGTVYKSTLDCFAQSVRSEGLLCLWNGFWPNFGRVGPRVIIVFVVMEQLKKLFDRR
eukprot:c8617_g1_i1.p2 GENE.c8617_g1_i1~~c8617_g1_i1.p2  ORF type:complete len:303 (+),score=56.20 c8617_g1_i1:152-1060(+)